MPLPKSYTPAQIAPIIIAVGCLCAVFGWVGGSTFGFFPRRTSSSSGGLTSQQETMEAVRQMLVSQTAEAVQATEALFPAQSEEIRQIHALHDFLSKGSYDQAWCLTSQEDLPWGATYEEFVNYWSAHPARLMGPVTPVEGSLGWFNVNLRDEGIPGLDRQYKYRLFPGSNAQCIGWLITEVIPGP